MKPGSAIRLGALALLWGSSFLWIKLALHGLSPVQIAAARLAIGAGLLTAVVHGRGLRLPRDRDTWLALIVAAFFANALPYTLFGIGERSVDSSVAGAINATTPLCTFAVGLVGAGRAADPMGPRRVAGLLLGFCGAVLLLAPWRGLHGGELPGSLACLAASASYGLAFVYMSRRLIGPGGTPPLVLAAAQLIASTGWMLVAVPVVGRGGVDVRPEVVGAVVALGLGGTGLAYILNYRLLSDEGPAATSTVTYLMPMVSVALGSVFLDESIGANLVLGTVVVLAGVGLAQRRGLRAAPVEASATGLSSPAASHPVGARARRSRPARRARAPRSAAAAPDV